MNVVLIGPSGAGKGTQAFILAEDLEMVHLSPGDLFRDNVLHKTPLGILAQEYMSQGGLVPDNVTDGMIRESLKKIPAEQSVVFDGFPRSLYQVQTLDEILAETGRTLDAVIYLDVSDLKILNNRLPGRLTCATCQKPFHEQHAPPRLCQRDNCSLEKMFRRGDDTPERARDRLRIFHRQNTAILEHYNSAGKLTLIDGEQPILKVSQDIIEALEKRLLEGGHPTDITDLQKLHQLKPVTTALTLDEVSNTSIDVVLLGSPGSGKGTQAQKLRQQFSLKHIATGDIFRENIKTETNLGKLAKSFINRGELVPDEVTEAMIRDRLAHADTQDGTILDGFPRTLSQAEALDEMMTNLRRRIAGVIYIKVSDAEIMRRLSGRLICRQCVAPFHQEMKPFAKCPYQKCKGEHLYQRDDDKAETVSQRLRTYHRQTEPLVEYYRRKGLLIEIDGEGDVEAITQRIMAAADSLNVLIS